MNDFVALEGGSGGPPPEKFDYLSVKWWFLVLSEPKI